MPAATADQDTPSREDVEQARQDADNAERTVAAVQTDLMLANQRLERASISAAQAGEAFSAARWELDQARARVAAADVKSVQAHKKLAIQQDAYFDLVASTYEMSPGLTSMSAIANEEGIEGVLENSNTVYNLNSSMGDITTGYDAARKVADITTEQAETARDGAAKLEDAAAAARAGAERKAQAALDESTAVAMQKDGLIAELADLQNISVELATRRQSDLEAAALQRRATAAAAEQARQERSAQQERSTQQESIPAQDKSNNGSSSGSSNSGNASNSGGSSGSNSDGNNSPITIPPPVTVPRPDPIPDPTPTPQPKPTPKPKPKPTPKPKPKPKPTPPPPSSGGAQSAISFARAQLGDPYVWASAGPDSWDCSGLMMMAWRQGGKSLPHYSVGQYTSSTPISSSDLKPGDLVFWGSSSSASSIYHVALYAGNGRIIHAPRTGRPVAEESLYYWIPPNFYARP